MVSNIKHRGITKIGNKVFKWGLRTYVMGVLNVTPDSFSGDGTGNDPDFAVNQALRFEDCGADIIDIGGESTRPSSIYAGAGPVSVDEELNRVIPVVEKLAQVLSVPISIDTHKSEVAREAILAGASMINDIWGLKADSEMAVVASNANVPVVLMHNQVGTSYCDLIQEVTKVLSKLIEDATSAGIGFENLIVDPGIGFGKTPEQNLEILRRLDEFDCLGRPILIGMSRKSTIGFVLDLPVEERVEGTAASVAISIALGGDIVRVHDVKEMVRVARMADAIVRGWAQTTDRGVL